VHYWNFPSTDEEYQIAGAHEIPEWKMHYDSIDYDKPTGLFLLKRKTAYERILLDSLAVSTPATFNGEYFNLVEAKAGSLRGKMLYMGYRLTFASAATPFNTRIVIDIGDNNGKSLAYEYISLNWLKLHYTGDGQNFINGMLIHQIPPQAATIKSYIWNLDKTDYTMKGKIYLFEMKDAG